MSSFSLAMATLDLADDVRTAISLAAKAGAAGVLFDARLEVRAAKFGESARRDLLHALTERGLHVAGIHYPLRRPLYEAEALGGRIDALCDAMQLASRLHCRSLLFRAGPLPPEDAKRDRDTLRDALNEIARLGNRIGVTPLLGTAGEDPAQLEAVLSLVTDGPIGVDFDPAGCIIGGRRPLPVLQALHRHVKHVQARDALQSVESGGEEVVLGRGETPWDEVLGTLADMRYAGWISVRRTQGADRAGDAARAVQFIKTIAAGG